MRIGVDFGTTNSKIAYMPSRDRLALFKFPGESGNTYIPTAVAYERQTPEQPPLIGEAARSAMQNTPEGVDYCVSFKMLLPIESKDEWRREGWRSQRTPIEATSDYLRELLYNDPLSFTKARGTIESAVVSVPQVWQDGSNGNLQALDLGRETLQQILLDRLRLPLDHIRSEPVCAAAYYAWRYQQLEGQERRREPFKGNLLVCDMGGGTFDVALCHVNDKQITVKEFEGNGKSGIERAGVAFDRAMVIAAYQDKHKAAPDLASAEFVDMLIDFERLKILNHPKLVNRLDAYSGSLGLDGVMSEAPTEYDDAAIYQMKGGYVFTLRHIREAFRPVRAGIKEVLSRISQRMSAKGEKVDRLAIVGGFGQFPFVRHAILKELNISPTGDVRYDAT
ncbi:MAG TPA: Hsp70 family protein, partial [Chloroflexia bacterium]